VFEANIWLQTGARFNHHLGQYPHRQKLRSRRHPRRAGTQRPARCFDPCQAFPLNGTGGTLSACYRSKPGHPMPAPVVDAKGINLHLKSGATSLHILKDVDLTLQPGEVTAIVGPSGSGKTSLLMVLSGLEQATSGTINVAGTNIATLNEDQLAIFRRNALGILFQNFHLIPSLTALENVALTLEIAEPSLPWTEIRDRAAAALSDVGLAGRLTHLPSALSGGEQQRVGLARAMVGNPKLLLADEPTGNLDQETGAQVIELMFGLARTRGTAILLITHDPSLARKADRQLRMNEGHLSERVPA
jgi:putative ABC transport system ATP-binding protein